MEISIRHMEIDDIRIVKPWIEEKKNHIWLDTPLQTDTMDEKELAIMLLKKSNKVYIFQVSDKPSGIVALANIDMTNRSGMLWYLLGDKSLAGRGVTSEAVKSFLKISFGEFGLHSINAWSVADNKASCRILQKSGFREIGRQRECHYMEGVFKDRLLYDITIGDIRKPDAV
jgi:RimJ/RimL family protein N-acetyltransferase